MAETISFSALFIEPGTRVDEHHPQVRRFATASRNDLRYRWTTDRGKQLLQRLRDSRFERRVVESSVGRLYENYDLRGIPLSGCDLANADLHNIDFFAADLRETRFFGCNLTNSHFSEADIRGADFSFARMNDAFLDNAIFDLKTNFTGVDIRHVNFNLAALLQDQARAQQRIAHLKARHPLFALALRATCNYGQSLGLWAVWVLGAIFLFAGLYTAFPNMTNAHGFFDALYFSVTTFSTLGLGDVAPVALAGKIVVMIEVVSGYLMGGLFIAILVRRLIGS